MKLAVKQFLLVIIGGVLLFLIGCALILIIGDISAGALHGKPETGWGFLIALIFFGPLIVVAAIIETLLYRSYKKSMHPVNDLLENQSQSDHNNLSPPPTDIKVD